MNKYMCIWLLNIFHFPYILYSIKDKITNAYRLWLDLCFHFFFFLLFSFFFLQSSCYIFHHRMGSELLKSFYPGFPGFSIFFCTGKPGQQMRLGVERRDWSYYWAAGLQIAVKLRRRRWKVDSNEKYSHGVQHLAITYPFKPHRTCKGVLNNVSKVLFFFLV